MSLEHDYEKLGVFYLGRERESVGEGESADNPLLYDSRDLTTHAVIIGMTGSGKTGLGIGLLEEAAIDRIPVIAIDPKGDLGNLLLTFPDLKSADFRPWVDEEAARRRDLDIDAYAAEQAALWKKGLAEWDQDGERIRRLRAHAEFALYTPGSAAGRQVSVLRSFDAPPAALVDDADAFRDRVGSSVSALLGLLGIDADPVRSREHILLSSILDDAWRGGRSLDLGALIQAIQQPPFTRLGVMELESVYPARDRFALAMQLNSLLASPGFQAWMEGEPLDVGALLYTPKGKPRVSIFSIAHLGDSERMYFVTMLLSAVLAWTRAQPGTSSLRALVYMDEVFGFFPPSANPPSKLPMLTLLKQARAFGVGMVLATQNPVDLDYKGLGNTGTWFIGRLQTERDKARLLEALDGAMAGSNPVPRAELDRLISNLGQRMFLLHNVHRGAPRLFATRWVMSYLAGPMTLTQIRALAAREDPAAAVEAGPAAQAAAGAPVAAAPAEPAPVLNVSGAVDAATAPPVPRPILPPDIRQFFRAPVARVEGMVYRPSLYAAAEVRYANARLGVEETRPVQLLVPLVEGLVPFSLDQASLVDLPVATLEAEPLAGAGFAALPADAGKVRSYDRWGRELVRWIQGAAALTLLRSPDGKQTSRPGESEQAFRIRLAEHAREQRDAEADRLRQRYEGRIRILQDRLARAEQAAERKRGQSRQAMISTGVAAIGGMLGALAGSGRGQIGRAGTAVRGAGRVMQTRQEATRAGESVEAVRAQIAELEQELQAELHRLDDPTDAGQELETVAVRPALNAISLRVTGLAWLPWGTDGNGQAVPVWR